MEIQWTLKFVNAGYSNNSNADCSCLFLSMFPDSNIAKKYHLGSDRLQYSVNFVFSPYFKNILMESIRKSALFVIRFDESHNKATQSSELDFLVQYLDVLEIKVSARYVTSVYLGHSRHTDLHSNFTSLMDELSEDKLVQLFMDGPSVNTKLLQAVQDNGKDKRLPHLLEIGTCGLHTLHGSLKMGIERIEWEMKSFMKACFNILMMLQLDGMTMKVTKSSKFPLLFFAVRWNEDVTVADRLIEVWSNIKQTMNFWENLELVMAKFVFFSYLTGMFKPFLTAYQTDCPMIPFLYGDLFKFLENIFAIIIKPDIMNKCETEEAKCQKLVF